MVEPISTLHLELVASNRTARGLGRLPAELQQLAERVTRLYTAHLGRNVLVILTKHLLHNLIRLDTRLLIAAGYFPDGFLGEEDGLFGGWRGGGELEGLVGFDGWFHSLFRHFFLS